MSRRRKPTSLRRRLRAVRRRFALRRVDSKVTRSNLAQAAVTVGVAVTATVGALLASEAGGAWEESVREQIQHAAAMGEDVRYVYADEAPVAFDLAVSRARIAELPAAQAEVERKAHFELEQAAIAGG